jgi:general nucleoside transport system permease protein
MIEFLLSFLFFLSPLLIAASGSLVAELSGRTNMALEGFILSGAFCAALLMASGCGAAISCILAMVAAGAACAILSVCIDRFGTDPIMAGLAANLIAQSGTGALAKILFGSQGILRLSMPAYKQAMGQASVVIDLCAAAAVFGFAWIFIAQTREGLRIRALGSNQAAAKSSGVNPGLSRALAFSFSGIACALAGALYVVRLSAWSTGMTFGKGWLALAAMYVGRASFPGLLLSCILFSLVETFANLLQGQSSLPQEWSLAFPYIATLVFMAFVQRRKGKKE